MDKIGTGLVAAIGAIGGVMIANVIADEMHTDSVHKMTPYLVLLGAAGAFTAAAIAANPSPTPAPQLKAPVPSTSGA